VTGIALRLIFSFLVVLCLHACNAPAEDDVPKGIVQNDGLRIITLSPHLAELVFAVGAGNHLVGVSAYTDYPLAAASLPVVGDAFNLDQEQLALLEPDLLLAWDTGTPTHVIDELRARGYEIEVVTTTALTDIGDALLQIGSITDNVDRAVAAADEFNSGLQDIAEAAKSASLITVFYQVDARPLYTINGTHFVSELIGLCGGKNIFADLDGLAPLVSVEAVLERNPEVMLASTDAGDTAFNEWDRWPDIPANRFGNRFLMPANDIGRPTPRLLAGAAAVCSALHASRVNRDQAGHD